MEKSVMIVGPRFHSYNIIIGDAFKKYGFNFFIVDVDQYKEKYSDKLIGRVAKKNLESRRESTIKSNSSYLLHEFLLKKPDYVLIIKGDSLSTRVVESISQKVPTALWVMDSFINSPNSIAIAKILKSCYVFEASDIDKFAGQGFSMSFLPVGYDENIYMPHRANKDIDLCFVGNLSIERRKILESLARDFPNLKMSFYGKYVNNLRLVKYHKYKVSNMDNFFMNKTISHIQANELYNRSRLCLNIHNSQSYEGWNVRMNEILGAGAFELVDENPAILREYGDFVSIYKSYEDLKDKIIYFLDHADERNIIAKRGYDFALENHTFTKRIRTIIDDWGGEELHS